MDCRFKANKVELEVGHSVNITAGDEVEMAYAMVENGPIALGYQVKGDFKAYKSGVYRNDDCGTRPDQVNHAVLAVGYGTENGIDYWYVKNSWDESWGDHGFFKIERGVNMCALAQCNSFPEYVKLKN